MNEFPTSESKGRILVVDDSPNDLLFLVELLRRDGYTLYPASDGRLVFQFLQFTLPDLVLLDTNMPGMSGYAVCEQLKANHATQNIPVIFVTGADQLLDKVKAFSLGAVDYILKPYQAEEVLMRIRTHLSLRTLQRSLEQRVQERTSELLNANMHLSEEIAARKQAEEEVRRQRDHLEEMVAERTAELIAAKQRVEVASNAKSIFLATMSHELRTPLNAIMGYAQLLLRGKFSRELEIAGLTSIHTSGEHLLALINDILDLAKVEAGKLDLYLEVVNFPPLLKSIADMIQIRTEQKSLVFNYEAPPTLPKAVIVDQRRLRQILLNLLGNAVKFTNRGQVTLRVRTVSSDRTSATIRFEIEDTGVGIDEDQLGVLFQPFHQVGDIRFRSGGAGLGLAISRQLVRLMDSDIHVESKRGEGSLFWFELTLPVSVEVMTPAPAQIAIGYLGPRKKALIVDDTSDSRMILTSLLGPLGFEVIEAEDGAEALVHAQMHRPDIILMDMIMPVMNGLEAIRRLRAIPDFRVVPIIALSAGASQADQQDSRDVGANAFHPKPIHMDRLLSDIASLLQLTWIYEEMQYADAPPAQDSGDLVPPPLEEMTKLYWLAMMGNMREIRQRAAHVASLGAEYRPFADTLGRLAADYESVGILKLIERHWPPGAPLPVSRSGASSDDDVN